MNFKKITKAAAKAIVSHMVKQGAELLEVSLSSDDHLTPKAKEIFEEHNSRVRTKRRNTHSVGLPDGDFSFKD
jgi:nanoRNase/pAp phosphatase (c-di-AMP/oligoRNAs hydrolase)